jgi:hypothetical protein
MTESGMQLVATDREPRLRANALGMTEGWV